MSLWFPYFKTFNKFPGPPRIGKTSLEKLAWNFKSCVCPQSQPNLSCLSPVTWPTLCHSHNHTSLHRHLHTPSYITFEGVVWQMLTFTSTLFNRCLLLLPVIWVGSLGSMLTEILNGCRTVLVNSGLLSALLYLGSKGPYCFRLWLP